MPGDGIRTAITSAEPPARCLDLTRLISRVGRGAYTGVDRVERAYLDRLLQHPTPSYALVRTVLGHVLLDTDGARALRERLDGDVPWGPPDLIGRVSRRLTEPRRRAEADLRRLALDRAPRGRLAALLARRLPPGTAYLNVGHSNLTEEVFAAWAKLPESSISVLVHDLIPLTHPQFQRPGTVASFEGRMRRVSAGADLVICNSQATEAELHNRFAGWGRVPETLVAPLGVSMPSPDASALPPGLPPPDPYFVTLGTIEPRKNHALLLDVWEAMHREWQDADVPNLVIAGSRGWANEDLFRRLDTSPLRGRTIHEVAGLPDPAIAALIQGAAGLLFPSRVEGFGLPPAEAALLGTPVICATLDVYRETLGNIPVYADPDDVYQWQQTIRQLADEARAGHRRIAAEETRRSLPTWNNHFNLVLKVT